MNADAYLDDVRDSMTDTVLNKESSERPDHINKSADKKLAWNNGPVFA